MQRQESPESPLVTSPTTPMQREETHAPPSAAPYYHHHHSHHHHHNPQQQHLSGNPNNARHQHPATATATAAAASIVHNSTINNTDAYNTIVGNNVAGSSSTSSGAGMVMHSSIVGVATDSASSRVASPLPRISSSTAGGLDAMLAVRGTTTTACGTMGNTNTNSAIHNNTINQKTMPVGGGDDPAGLGLPAFATGGGVVAAPLPHPFSAAVSSTLFASATSEDIAADGHGHGGGGGNQPTHASSSSSAAAVAAAKRSEEQLILVGGGGGGGTPVSAGRNNNDDAEEEEGRNLLFKISHTNIDFETVILNDSPSFRRFEITNVLPSSAAEGGGEAILVTLTSTVACVSFQLSNENVGSLGEVLSSNAMFDYVETITQVTIEPSSSVSIIAAFKPDPQLLLNAISAPLVTVNGLVRLSATVIPSSSSATAAGFSSSSATVMAMGGGGGAGGGDSSTTLASEYSASNSSTAVNHSSSSAPQQQPPFNSATSPTSPTSAGGPSAADGFPLPTAASASAQKSRHAFPTGSNKGGSQSSPLRTQVETLTIASKVGQSLMDVAPNELSFTMGERNIASRELTVVNRSAVKLTFVARLQTNVRAFRVDFQDFDSPEESCLGRRITLRPYESRKLIMNVTTAGTPFGEYAVVAQFDNLCDYRNQILVAASVTVTAQNTVELISVDEQRLELGDMYYGQHVSKVITISNTYGKKRPVSVRIRHPPKTIARGRITMKLLVSGGGDDGVLTPSEDEIIIPPDADVQALVVYYPDDAPLVGGGAGAKPGGPSQSGGGTAGGGNANSASSGGGGNSNANAKKDGHGFDGSEKVKFYFDIVATDVSQPQQRQQSSRNNNGNSTVGNAGAGGGDGGSSSLSIPSQTLPVWCRAHLYESIINVSSQIVRFGDVYVSQHKISTFAVDNLSPLPGRIAIMLHSKILSIDGATAVASSGGGGTKTTFLDIGPLSKLHVKLRLAPQRVNPEYRKQLVVRNMNAPQSQTDFFISVESNNMAPEETKLHDAQYAIERLSSTVHPHILCRVPYIVPFLVRSRNAADPIVLSIQSTTREIGLYGVRKQRREQSNDGSSTTEEEEEESADEEDLPEDLAAEEEEEEEVIIEETSVIGAGDGTAAADTGMTGGNYTDQSAPRSPVAAGAAVGESAGGGGGGGGLFPMDPAAITTQRQSSVVISDNGQPQQQGVGGTSSVMGVRGRRRHGVVPSPSHPKIALYYPPTSDTDGDIRLFEANAKLVRALCESTAGPSSTAAAPRGGGANGAIDGTAASLLAGEKGSDGGPQSNSKDGDGGKRNGAAGSDAAGGGGAGSANTANGNNGGNGTSAEGNANHNKNSGNGPLSSNANGKTAKDDGDDSRGDDDDDDEVISLPQGVSLQNMSGLCSALSDFLHRRAEPIETITLAPLQSRVIYVVFNRGISCPNWSSKEDCLSISMRGTEQPRIVRLSYRLCESRLDISQKSRSFGDVDLGDRKAMRISIRNACDAPLWFSVEKSTSVASLRIGNVPLKGPYYEVIKGSGVKDFDLTIGFGLRGAFRETLTITNLLDPTNVVQLQLKAEVKKVDQFEVNPESIVLEATLPSFSLQNASSSLTSSPTTVSEQKQTIDLAGATISTAVSTTVAAESGGGGDEASTTPAAPTTTTTSPAVAVPSSFPTTVKCACKITVTNTSKARRDICVKLTQPLEHLLTFYPSTAAAAAAASSPLPLPASSPRAGSADLDDGSGGAHLLASAVSFMSEEVAVANGWTNSYYANLQGVEFSLEVDESGKRGTATKSIEERIEALQQKLKIAQRKGKLEKIALVTKTIAKLTAALTGASIPPDETTNDDLVSEDEQGGDGGQPSGGGGSGAPSSNNNQFLSHKELVQQLRDGVYLPSLAPLEQAGMLLTMTCRLKPPPPPSSPTGGGLNGTTTATMLSGAASPSSALSPSMAATTTTAVTADGANVSNGASGLFGLGPIADPLLPLRVSVTRMGTLVFCEVKDAEASKAIPLAVTIHGLMPPEQQPQQVTAAGEGVEGEEGTDGGAKAKRQPSTEDASLDGDSGPSDKEGAGAKKAPPSSIQGSAAAASQGASQSTSGSATPQQRHDSTAAAPNGGATAASPGVAPPSSAVTSPPPPSQQLPPLIHFTADTFSRLSSFLGIPTIAIHNSVVNEPTLYRLALTCVNADTTCIFMSPFHRCGGNAPNIVNARIKCSPASAQLSCDPTKGPTSILLEITPKTIGPQRYFLQFRNANNAGDVVHIAVEMNPLPSNAISVEMEGAVVDFGTIVTPILSSTLLALQQQLMGLPPATVSSTAPTSPNSVSAKGASGGGGGGGDGFPSPANSNGSLSSPTSTASPSALAASTNGGSGSGSGSGGIGGIVTRTLVIRNKGPIPQGICVYTNRPTQLLIALDAAFTQRLAGHVVRLDGRGGALKVFVRFIPTIGGPHVSNFTRQINSGITIEAMEVGEVLSSATGDAPHALQSVSATVTQSITVRAVVNVGRCVLRVGDDKSIIDVGVIKAQARGGQTLVTFTLHNSSDTLPLTYRIDLSPCLALEPLGTTLTQTIQGGSATNNNNANNTSTAGGAGGKRVTIAVKPRASGPIREMITLHNLTAEQPPIQIPVVGFRDDGTVALDTESLAMPMVPIHFSSSEEEGVCVSNSVVTSFTLTNNTVRELALICKVSLPIHITSTSAAGENLDSSAPRTSNASSDGSPSSSSVAPPTSLAAAAAARRKAAGPPPRQNSNTSTAGNSANLQHQDPLQQSSSGMNLLGSTANSDRLTSPTAVAPPPPPAGGASALSSSDQLSSGGYVRLESKQQRVVRCELFGCPTFTPHELRLLHQHALVTRTGVIEIELAAVVGHNPSTPTAPKCVSMVKVSATFGLSEGVVETPRIDIGRFGSSTTSKTRISVRIRNLSQHLPLVLNAVHSRLIRMADKAVTIPPGGVADVEGTINVSQCVQGPFTETIYFNNSANPENDLSATVVGKFYASLWKIGHNDKDLKLVNDTRESIALPLMIIDPLSSAQDPLLSETRVRFSSWERDVSATMVITPNPVVERLLLPLLLNSDATQLCDDRVEFPEANTTHSLRLRCVIPPRCPPDWLSALTTAFFGKRINFNSSPSNIDAEISDVLYRLKMTPSHLMWVANIHVMDPVGSPDDIPVYASMGPVQTFAVEGTAPCNFTLITPSSDAGGGNSNGAMGGGGNAGNNNSSASKASLLGDGSGAREAVTRATLQLTHHDKRTAVYTAHIGLQNTTVATARGAGHQCRLAVTPILTPEVAALAKVTCDQPKATLAPGESCIIVVSITALRGTERNVESSITIMVVDEAAQSSLHFVKLSVPADVEEEAMGTTAGGGGSNANAGGAQQQGVLVVDDNLMTSRKPARSLAGLELKGCAAVSGEDEFTVALQQSCARTPATRTVPNPTAPIVFKVSNRLQGHAIDYSVSILSTYPQPWVVLGDGHANGAVQRLGPQDVQTVTLIANTSEVGSFEAELIVSNLTETSEIYFLRVVFEVFAANVSSAAGGVGGGQLFQVLCPSRGGGKMQSAGPNGVAYLNLRTFVAPFVIESKYFEVHSMSPNPLDFQIIAPRTCHIRPERLASVIQPKLTFGDRTTTVIGNLSVEPRGKAVINLVLALDKAMADVEPGARVEIEMDVIVRCKVLRDSQSTVRVAFRVTPQSFDVPCPRLSFDRFASVHQTVELLNKLARPSDYSIICDSRLFQVATERFRMVGSSRTSIGFQLNPDAPEVRLTPGQLSQLMQSQSLLPTAEQLMVGGPYAAAGGGGGATASSTTAANSTAGGESLQALLAATAGGKLPQDVIFGLSAAALNAIAVSTSATGGTLTTPIINVSVEERAFIYLRSDPRERHMLRLVFELTLDLRGANGRVIGGDMSNGTKMMGGGAGMPSAQSAQNLLLLDGGGIGGDAASAGVSSAAAGPPAAVVTNSPSMAPAVATLAALTGPAGTSSQQQMARLGVVGTRVLFSPEHVQRRVREFIRNVIKAFAVDELLLIDAIQRLVDDDEWQIAKNNANAAASAKLLSLPSPPASGGGGGGSGRAAMPTPLSSGGDGSDSSAAVPPAATPVPLSVAFIGSGSAGGGGSSATQPNTPSRLPSADRQTLAAAAAAAVAGAMEDQQLSLSGTYTSTVANMMMAGGGSGKATPVNPPQVGAGDSTPAGAGTGIAATALPSPVQGGPVAADGSSPFPPPPLPSVPTITVVPPSAPLDATSSTAVGTCSGGALTQQEGDSTNAAGAAASVLSPSACSTASSAPSTTPLSNNSGGAHVHTFVREERLMLELCRLVDDILYLMHHRELRAGANGVVAMGSGANGGVGAPVAGSAGGVGGSGVVGGSGAVVMGSGGGGGASALLRLWLTMAQMLNTSVMGNNVMRAFVERKLWDCPKMPAPILKHFAISGEKLREAIVHCERNLHYGGGGGGGGSGGGAPTQYSTSSPSASVPNVSGHVGGGGGMGGPSASMPTSSSSSQQQQGGGFPASQYLSLPPSTSAMMLGGGGGGGGGQQNVPATPLITSPNPIPTVMFNGN